MDKRFDVVIVGAGVMGISLAYHLSRAGKQVLVLEKEIAAGQHASGKNAGMMRQLYHHPQLTNWAERSIADWPQAVKDIAFKRTGSMIVGRDLPDHHAHLFDVKSANVYIDNRQQILPAVYAANDGLLDPHAHTSGLVTLAREQGATFMHNTTVASIEKLGQDWLVTAINEQGQTIEFRAPWLVNAAGAWINTFLGPDSGLQVQAQPFARHLCVVDGWELDFMPASNIGFYWEEATHWYVRQWDANSRLVSICDETPAIPEEFVPDPDLPMRIAEQLAAALPDQYEQLRLGRSWHCFRTYTKDQQPIWGEDVNVAGLFWLAAFGGFGMSTSYAATEDAARYICGKTTPVTDDFSPARVQNNGSTSVGGIHSLDF